MGSDRDRGRVMEWYNEKAKDLLSFKTGKLDSNAAEEDGKYPFFTCAQETYRINKYAFDTECVLLAGNNAAGIFPLKYYKGRFNAYQRTYIIEPKDRNEINTRYIYESFKLFLKSFEQTSTGATTKFLTMGILNNLWISKPPFPIQRKIAAVLSAYDDLIENNNRRIAILEKMAGEIYREWFVRMRFPGHDVMHKRDTDIGNGDIDVGNGRDRSLQKRRGLPKGWELLPFSKLVHKNPPCKVDPSDAKPYVGMEDLSTTSMMFFHKEYRQGNAGSKFQNRDVLFPRITPSVENGKRAYAMNLEDGQIGIGSTEFIVFREKILSPEVIYFITCLPEFRKHAEISMAGASGRQRVQENCFDFFLIKTPPESLMKQFSTYVRPMFLEIKNLFDKNKVLTTSRDLLLSRLITGKLSVEDLDIKFPMSMKEEGVKE